MKRFSGKGCFGLLGDFDGLLCVNEGRVFLLFEGVRGSEVRRLVDGEFPGEDIFASGSHWLEE